MAAYIGSFASGFMSSFLAAKSFKLQQENQEMLKQYYGYLMKNGSYDPQSGKYWDPASGKFSSPVFVAPESADSKAFREGTSNYDQGQGKQPGGWWTPDRMQHVSDRLQKEAGLSPAGAAGLVARWSAVEAGSGPGAVNPKSQASGINQALGDRKPPGYAGWDVDKQLDYIIKTDLNDPAQAKALQVLKTAKTADEASRGASMYERAEGYSDRSGTDNYTRTTPVQKVMDTISGVQNKGGTASTDAPAPGQKYKFISGKTDKDGIPYDANAKPIPIDDKSTPESKPSALPGGPPGQPTEKPIRTSSLDPTSGFQELANRQAKGAIPTQNAPAIGSPAPAVPPPRPQVTPGVTPAAPTPAAQVAPAAAVPPAQGGGEYQPASGNARAAQWVPNHSPNPPIAATPATPPQAAAPPSRAIPPPPGAPGGPPALKTPEAPAAAAPEQPQQDATQMVAQGNAQREQMAQMQLLKEQQDQDQNQGTIAAAKGGSITKFYAGGNATNAGAAAGEAAGGGGMMSGGTQAIPFNTNGTGGQPFTYNSAPAMGDFLPGQSGAMIAAGQGYKNFGNLGNGFWSSQAGVPNANPMTGAEVAANLKTLSPQQQQWYQQAAANHASNASWYYNPASYSALPGVTPTTPAAPTAAIPAPTPVAAPATPVTPVQTAVNPASGAAPAPTPVTGLSTPLGTMDSTKNTSINIASNPNYTNATDYNLNSAAQMNATNANPNAAVTSSLQNNNYWADGGPVAGYDDGGSVAGMPPGLPQQQTIPPVYYNPATYAAAGAPIGRGVSATSAPVYKAASVPTFAKGGIIGYDDGGDVGDDPQQGIPPQQMAMNMPGDGGQPPDQQMAMSTFPHHISTGVPMPRATAPAIKFPHVAAPHMPGGRGAQPKAPPEHLGNPNENMEPVGDAPQSPPPGAPQIEDGYGNPSHGLMDAITDGLHTLGQALGMSGPNQPNQPSGAIPGDASISANQRAFARGEGAASPDQMNQVYKMIDPGKSLDNGMRNLAGLEAVHNQHLLDGDYDGAGKVAASMLMYAKTMSAKYGDEAVKRFQSGDIDKALASLKDAADMVPDGRKVHFEKTDNGNVDVAITNLRNVVEWKQTMAPKDILAYAVKAQDGSLYWDALETQAAKYDPEYKEMQAQKKQDAQSQQETIALNQMYPGQTQGSVQSASAGQMPAPQQVSTGPSAQAPVTPGVTPNPGVPSGDSSGTAQSAIPPPGSAQRGGAWPPSNFANLTPQQQNSLTKQHILDVNQSKLDQQEEFKATSQVQAQKHAEQMADRKEATATRMADIKDKATRNRAANAPMPIQELTKTFEGKSPVDTLGESPSLTQAAGGDAKNVPAFLDKTFGQDGVHTLGRAVWNGQSFNPRMQTGDIAEAVAGLATNRYAIDGGSAKEISDEYGPRYRFDFGVKGQDGKVQSMGTMVLTQQDLEQINRLKAIYQQAKTTAPTQKPIPWGGSPSTGAPPPGTRQQSVPGPQPINPRAGHAIPPQGSIMDRLRAIGQEIR